jgi:hypothetical protein
VSDGIGARWSARDELVRGRQGGGDRCRALGSPGGAVRLHCDEVWRAPSLAIRLGRGRAPFVRQPARRPRERHSALAPGSHSDGAELIVASTNATAVAARNDHPPTTSCWNRRSNSSSASAARVWRPAHAVALKLDPTVRRDGEGVSHIPNERASKLRSCIGVRISSPIFSRIIGSTMDGYLRAACFDADEWDGESFRDEDRNHPCPPFAGLEHGS